MLALAAILTMQKTILFIAFLITLTFDSLAQSPYQIKSCKIDFVFFNSFQKGTKTLIFKDSGKIEKEIGEIYSIDTKALKKLGWKKPRPVMHVLHIRRQDSVFFLDLDSMVGSGRFALTLVGSSHPEEPIIQTGKDTFDVDILAFVNSQKKKIGEDTLLGRPCDIIDFNGVKIWYWKGLALKKEIIPQKVYEYATSIDENYVIKEDEFKIPNGVKLR